MLCSSHEGSEVARSVTSWLWRCQTSKGAVHSAILQQCLWCAGGMLSARTRSMRWWCQQLRILVACDVAASSCGPGKDDPPVASLELEDAPVASEEGQILIWPWLQVCTALGACWRGARGNPARWPLMLRLHLWVIVYWSNSGLCGGYMSSHHLPMLSPLCRARNCEHATAALAATITCRHM